MESDHLSRQFYVKIIRAHRSRIVIERQRIESHKENLRQNYILMLSSNKYRSLVKPYLWINLLLRIYEFESKEERRLLRIRNAQERALHLLKIS